MNINLNRRERLIVGGAAVVLAALFFFHFAIAPVFAKKNQLNAELDAKLAIAVEMRKLSAEYRLIVNHAESALRRTANRPANFSLFSFLERLAGTSGIKEKITYMRPDTSVDELSGLTISRVEMRLQDITIEELATYLFQVEADENRVHISRMSITKSSEQEGPINVVMRVETLESS